MILAVNKAKNNKRKYSGDYNNERVLCGFICTLVLFFYIVFSTHSVGFWLMTVMLSLVALFTIIAIMRLDNYLRWYRGIETVSVQHEILVIECKGSVFRRKKEIPLSTIRRVETYDGKGDVPDTLCVVYSNSTYRFGIGLDDQKRDELARKITILKDQYV